MIVFSLIFKYIIGKIGMKISIAWPSKMKTDHLETKAVFCYALQLFSTIETCVQ